MVQQLAARCCVYVVAVDSEWPMVARDDWAVAVDAVVVLELIAIAVDARDLSYSKVDIQTLGHHKVMVVAGGLLYAVKYY